MTHLRTVAAIGALILATTSCGTDMDGHPTAETSTTPSSTVDPATLFDPCKDIPASFMLSEGFADAGVGEAFENETNGVKWKGCGWVMTDGYYTNIATTTLTLDVIKTKNFEDYTEFTIDDRHAVSYRRLRESGKRTCVANIELGAGTVDFSLGNPPSARDTGSTDSCELVRDLATKIAKFLPKQ